MKPAALKSEITFSSLYLASVSIVHTSKQLPNLQRLELIGTENSQEIPNQNSWGHAVLWQSSEGKKLSGRGRM